MSARRQKAPKSSLIDEVFACPGLVKRSGNIPWHDTIPADLRRELEEIRAQWRAGHRKATKLGLAKAISQVLAARGFTIGYQGVRRWLDD